MAQQGDYSVDIVMCIDATGSMAPIINEVKNNAMTFHEKFEAVMEDADKPLDALRIKVIVFKDYICDSEPMKESKFFELPKESAAFKDFVSSIEPMGGGDTPKNALEAIAKALQSDWTLAPGKKRHVVLLFTDAPAHPLGERKDCPGYPTNMPKDLAQLVAWWEGTDQDFVSNYSRKAGRMLVFAPNVEPWTEEMQEWNRYWHFFSRVGCYELDMDFIINILGAGVI